MFGKTINNFISSFFTSSHLNYKQNSKANIIADYENKLAEDGVNHIRVDNRGATLLGRMLDSQYVSPFHHPELGDFNTTEGFWFYISTSPKVEDFRLLNGYECRKLINNLRHNGKLNRIRIPNFTSHIFNANYLKIINNPILFNMMKESTLPFEFYYITKKYRRDGEVQSVLFYPNDRTWVLSQLNEIRDLVKSKNLETMDKNQLIMDITDKNYNLIREVPVLADYK